MKKALLILLTILLISCNKREKELELEIEKLKHDNKIQQNLLSEKYNDTIWKYRDTLLAYKQGIEHYNTEFYSLDNEFDKIENPRKFIEKSLTERKDLIPEEAILGGNMYFEAVKTIGFGWVIGFYTDGHIYGEAIYSYKLNKNKKVDFKLKSYKDQEG